MGVTEPVKIDIDLSKPGSAWAPLEDRPLGVYENKQTHTILVIPKKPLGEGTSKWALLR